jgi:plasmid stability protein
MPVNLSIKNVPDAIAAKLKERAARHHRSLQGELMMIIEEAIKEQPRLTLDEIWERGNRLGLSTPSESVQMIREDRDKR